MNITSATPFIKQLWEGSFFEKQELSIDDIQKLADTDGFRFTDSAIRMALNRAKYISKTKKIGGVQYYTQTYPSKSSSVKSKKSKPPHIQIFDLLPLHPEIKKSTEKLFVNEHYDQAVFSAFKKVNNLVKKKSDQVQLDGSKLMFKVFDGNSPILKINSMSTISDEDEQEGFMHIFAGSMIGIRNPRAHEDDIGGDPWITIEQISLASMLARIVDNSNI